MALERLRIYLRTKARVSALVKKQLQTTQTKCLQTLQNRENKSSTQKVQEVLSSFVKQRKKVNMESYTKMLEEEVKRAEEDYIKVLFYRIENLTLVTYFCRRGRER